MLKLWYPSSIIIYRLEDMTFTSIDIFYAALSICVVVFTGFLVWAIFYVVQILKQGNEIIAETREKVAEFEEALANIKERVITSANTVSFIGQEIGSIVEIVKSFRGSSSKSSRSRKS